MGVKLQSYGEGALRNNTASGEAEGAAWIDGAGRTHGWSECREWLGERAGAGKGAQRLPGEQAVQAESVAAGSVALQYR